MQNRNIGSFGDTSQEDKTLEVKLDTVAKCKFTDCMFTGVLYPGKSLGISIPENKKKCTIVFNKGELLLDLTNPIDSIPRSFSNSTARLLESHSACEIELENKMSSIYLYNIGKSVVISLIFD
jgi:hypothetical protein